LFQGAGLRIQWNQRFPTTPRDLDTNDLYAISTTSNLPTAAPGLAV
jgi:hypothetical protein